MANDLLDVLNPQQRAAVTASTGPVLVLAGPGSGKTRVLTHRIAYMIDEGISKYSIVAVTFTNKAAAEMSERASRLLGEPSGALLGTFHSICARWLRIEADQTAFARDYVIYDTDDQLSVIKGIVSEMNIDSKRFRPGSILGAISSAKNDLILPEEYVSGDYFSEIVSRVYPEYQRRLLNSNARDFDDLLTHMVLLLRDNPAVREKYQQRYEHIMVDEFQDTNQVQYELVRLLGAPQENVFVVGDEDQGVYAFRGADYRNVMQFRRDYPKRARDPAGAELPLDPDYPRRRPRRDRPEQEPHAQSPIHRPGGRRVGLALRGVQRRRGGRLRRPDDQPAEEEAGLQLPRLRRDVPHQRPVTRAGGRFYQVRHHLQADRRGGLLQAARGARFDRLPARDQQPERVGQLRTDHQHAGARHRREVAGIVHALGVRKQPDDRRSARRDLRGTPTTLTGRAAKSFAEFAALIADLQTLAAHNDLTIVFDELVARIGYNLYLKEISDTPEQGEERLENIAALRGLISDKKDLELNDFLVDTALVSEIDTLDPEKDGVTLLTLHSAKGLEFPVVFLTGLEDGLLPHSRSFSEPDAMEEERRLLYVGLTRAKDDLFLTYCFRRSLYGESIPGIPSRFLADIPAELTEGVSGRVQALRDRAGFQAATTWNRELAPPAAGKIISFEQAVRKQRETRFKAGQRVYHAKFGEGTVIDARPDGQDEEVQVRFVKYGMKLLAANYANLIVLE